MPRRYVGRVHQLEGRGTAADAPHAVLWWDRLVAGDPAAGRPRPPLDGDTTADVVVVGAGSTGVWTAYYLLEADPSLDVLVLDADRAGAGGGGRSAGAVATRPLGDPDAGREDVEEDRQRDLRAALRDSVVEVGGVLAAEQVDAGFRYGGLVTLARTFPAVDRVAARAAAAPRLGDEERLLDGVGAARHVRAEGVLAATWSPDGAHVDPVRLQRGLLDVLEARGARVAERTAALRVSPGAVATVHGVVRAPRVVVTTGATTVPGAPGAASVVRSGALATEPLPEEVWQEVGLAPGVTVVEDRHRPLQLVRSTDDRLVAGGAPDDLLRVADLLPAVRHHAVTHVWTARHGVTGDGRPAVGLDAGSGIAWGVGAGVGGPALANLAGRVLADLVTGAGSALTELPWVRRPAEPSRLAVPPAVRDAAAAWADRAEERRGRVPALAGLLARRLPR